MTPPMDDLPTLMTLNGKFSAYCGLCWEPVFSLWVDRETPDYNACAFGPYTAQTCPQATTAAKRAVLSAHLRSEGLTLIEYLDRQHAAPGVSHG